MIAVDLRAEAAAEARRLSAARGWLQEGDQRALLMLEGGGAWIAVPRRASLRRALGKRVCLVWRVSFEDASGRLVESRLVPVLVEPAADIGRILSDPASDAVIRARIEVDCRAWKAEAARVARAFTTARLGREREIAECPSTADPLSQPGLFDRRADRSRQSRAAALAAGRQAMLERQQGIESAGAIALRPARLLLVLVP